MAEVAIAITVAMVRPAPWLMIAFPQRAAMTPAAVRPLRRTTDGGQ
jgi:hypothetical protein